MKKPSTDFLLIDIINSFTKLAFASRSRIGRPSTIATPILTAERIARILHAHDAATVVASSVVPKKNREIKRAAGNRKIIWLTSQSRLNVRIDYPNPKSIGADRLANAVAVAKLYGTPAVVIDFGTAVTFDIMAAFFFQAEDGIRDTSVTGVQTCALPIFKPWNPASQFSRQPCSPCDSSDTHACSDREAAKGG